MNRAEHGKLLNTYFRSVYNKLEADALLFNRRLPHEGLKGSENEQALAAVLRDFLPGGYGVSFRHHSWSIAPKHDVLSYLRTDTDGLVLG